MNEKTKEKIVELRELEKMLDEAGMPWDQIDEIKGTLLGEYNLSVEEDQFNYVDEVFKHLELYESKYLTSLLRSKGEK